MLLVGSEALISASAELVSFVSLSLVITEDICATRSFALSWSIANMARMWSSDKQRSMGLGLKLWLCPCIVTIPNMRLGDMSMEHIERCAKEDPNISGEALTWYISWVQLCMLCAIQSGMFGIFFSASATDFSENDLKNNNGGVF
jgi:hypothetical protein